MSRPVDPDRYLRQIAERMTATLEREEMEVLLDELEYLYDVIDPVLQDSAETLMKQLRQKLGYAA
ncbi:MAG: hypothetical protein ACOY6N_01685 [Pseudomonadota bacterium]|uniref:hypothetical protein n=1 Tax=Sulfuricystis thermophila TaxID=2496847 RepID=UPI0010357CFD|nr:hypothetical protein [Sulfuricystis thermophila]MDI6749476.1 hypothetical protein [Rhodocyclaceae bacterium]